MRRPDHSPHSLRGRRLKGKGKGVWGARETQGAREEGGREGNACQDTIVFAIPPTNYVCKNNATVNDYSLSQNGWDTLGSPCPLHVGVQDLVTKPR